MDNMLNDVSTERVIQELTVLRDFWDIAKGDKLTIRFSSDEAKEEFKKEMDIAIEAVEKQIPKKPDFDFGYPNCKKCGASLNSEWYNGEICGDDFCSSCGNAIYWGDEDD